MAYYQLANYMRPEQPIYAIENQVAFRPRLTINSTIEEMAGLSSRGPRDLSEGT